MLPGYPGGDPEAEPGHFGDIIALGSLGTLMHSCGELGQRF